jgi:hypothetical protein
MVEILLCIRAKQLAFMTTNRALNNSFGSGGRWSIDNRWGVDIDWGHTLRLPLRQAAAAQIHSTPSNTQSIGERPDRSLWRMRETGVFNSGQTSTRLQ